MQTKFKHIRQVRLQDQNAHKQPNAILLRLTRRDKVVPSKQHGMWPLRLCLGRCGQGIVMVVYWDCSGERGAKVESLHLNSNQIH